MSSSFADYAVTASVWLIGAVVCLLAAPRVRLFADAGNGWPHNVPAAVSLARSNQLPPPRL